MDPDTVKFCGFCFQFPCSCDEVGRDIAPPLDQSSEEADLADHAASEAAGAYLGLVRELN